ncbi:MAG: hypothetical protein HYR72_13475 [Deltaproteobacteria bacterium]|nr:hypothetical protein [Deltaproteobacteria bacterium]MBI3391216.1 hypothetical protein [Deltaproteobacteria bacterium]
MISAIGAAMVNATVRRPALMTVALLLVSGCATLRPPAPAIAPPLPSAAELVTRLEQQRAARVSLRALAHFVYDGPDEHRRARQVVLVQRPERLRIEVLSPLGTVFVLTADNGALAAYVRSEATVYRGRASRANLQRYARVDLSVADAVDVLLGTPPVGDGRNDAVSFDPTSDTIQLSSATDAGAHVIAFDRALRAVAIETHDADAQVRWRAEFSAFAAPADVPTTIVIALPPQQQRLTLELQEVEVNPAIDAALFTLATPAGTREVALDDGAEAES